MSWNILKKAITDVIKTNGNEEITGQNLQNTLLSMVNALGDNSTFAGFALPTTNPGNPDGPVFYLANVAGVYSNFSGYEVKEGEAVVLNWDGSGNWSKHTLTTGAGGSNSVKDLGGIDNSTAFAYLANLDNLITKNDDGLYNFNKPILYTWNSGVNSNLVISISAPKFIAQFHFGYLGAIKVRFIQWSLSSGSVEKITEWDDYTVTSSRAGFMTPSMLKILEGASGVLGGNAQVIEWSHTHNMNDYKDAGTYRIKGERTGNPMTDNLPIMNSGSGHTLDGVLYVLDSSLTNGSGNSDDCTVTQFLMLSNRVGGQEGDMYMRSAYGANKDSLTWKPWEKYQTNMEVGLVSDDNLHNPSNPEQILKSEAGMSYLTENGIYSGIYLSQEALNDGAKVETFVMVVINNYMAAGNARCITQVKFAVTNGGVFSIEKRSGQVSSFSDWEPIGGVDQQLDGYSKNAVANAAVYKQFYAQQEEITKRATKANLAQGLDWEANTTKEFHIKNRTHHMKDYLCKYFTGSPIVISKPSDTGYVVIAYDTDGDAKYLKVEIKANEYKTQEFLDAMGLPIIFTWDNGASTINVQSFSGSLEKLCMRAYYSSSATSFDDYFVKLDEGFLPNVGGGSLQEVDITAAIKTDGLSTLIAQGLVKEGVTYKATEQMDYVTQLKLDSQDKIVNHINENGSIGASDVTFFITLKTIEYNKLIIIECYNDGVYYKYIIDWLDGTKDNVRVSADMIIL